MPAGNGSVAVVFDKPQFAVTPGQVAAFYDGDRVLGAGWIAAEAPSVAAPPVAHAGRGMP